MKNITLLFGLLLCILSCNKKSNGQLMGKIERDQIAVSSKIPGRLIEFFVREGDFVKKGDTLAVLDIPEVDAKKEQAEGAFTSAEAQYSMAVKGASKNQLNQLLAKQTAIREQYVFAEKSLKRLENLVKDSLVPQQTYDEAFAKYQGAKSQLAAVDAEIAGVSGGVRMEQQTMALGQKSRAMGALKEVEAAERERYIIAPQDMSIETRTLQLGELALPGYSLFVGYLSNSTYFRFSIPESELKSFSIDTEKEIKVFYNNKILKGKVNSVKQLGAYANIATAYPDYEVQESLFEVKILPENPEEAQSLFTKATVLVTLNNEMFTN